MELENACVHIALFPVYYQSCFLFCFLRDDMGGRVLTFPLAIFLGGTVLTLLNIFENMIHDKTTFVFALHKWITAANKVMGF